MASKTLDTNLLIDFWYLSLGKRKVTDVSREEVDGWSGRLRLQQGFDGIVTPVRIEFLCGVTSSDEEALATRYLNGFDLLDGGDVRPEDWQDAERIARRVPRDGRRRQLGDCLILAVCKRLRVKLLTKDTGIRGGERP